MAAIHEQAEKDYMLGMKYQAIADKYNVTINTVKSWKKRYGWQRPKKCAHKTEKRCTQKKSVQGDPVRVPEENPELTEKQRLFCLYYIKCFNATMAAIKAGYSKEYAHTEGSRLLRNVKVAAEIRRLKGEVVETLFIDAMDVLQQYAKIAFADLGDYVRFSGYAVQLANCDTVDTSVLSEVKEGKDGVSIKLVDKMKALEKLEQYFDLLPDKWQRQVEEEKLNINKAKLLLEVEKAKGENKSNQHVDALKQKMAERKMKNGSS